jgi:hypothetical protein
VSMVRPSEDSATSAAVSSPVRDDGDGTYLVEYTLDRIGAWSLSVRHGSADGDAIGSSPGRLICLPGSPHLPACRFISAQYGTRMLGAVDAAGGDEMHPAPGSAPFMGTVAACGSKLRVLVRLVDKAGASTRLSTARQVQLALLPEKDPLDAAGDGTNPGGHGGEGRVHDATLSAWVNQQLKAQRVADRNGVTALTAAPSDALANPPSASSAVAPAPAPPSSLEVPQISGTFEGSSIVRLQLVSTAGSSASGSEAADADAGTLGLALDDPSALYEGYIELRKARRYRLALCGSSGQALGPPLATFEAAAGRAHGPSCVVGGEGLEKGYMGAPVDFWLRTYDIAGNNLTKGGEKVSVSVKGPGHHDIVVKVRDEKDGGYALKFVPPAAGMHTLTIRLGREIVGSPINLMVYRSPTAAANALKLNLGVPPLQGAASIPRSDAPASARSTRRQSSPQASAPNSARRESSPRRAWGADTSPRSSAMSARGRASSPRLGPATAPSAEPLHAPRGNSPLRSTPKLDLSRSKILDRDELAHAPVSARACMQSPAAAPSAADDSSMSSSVSGAPATPGAVDAASAVARGRPPRSVLPPRLPINRDGTYNNQFAPAASEPARTAGSSAARRRESMGTPPLRDAPAPASARGPSPRQASPGPRVDGPASARGANVRHASPARGSSPRSSTASAMAPGAAPPRPASARGV